MWVICKVQCACHRTRDHEMIVAVTSMPSSFIYPHHHYWHPSLLSLLPSQSTLLLSSLSLIDHSLPTLQDRHNTKCSNSCSVVIGTQCLLPHATSTPPSPTHHTCSHTQEAGQSTILTGSWSSMKGLVCLRSWVVALHLSQAVTPNLPHSGREGA